MLQVTEVMVGRNQDLRDKIRSAQRIIEEHREKIRLERIKPHARQKLVAYWKAHE
jgi:hypothetical protein